MCKMQFALTGNLQEYGRIQHSDWQLNSDIKTAAQANFRLQAQQTTQTTHVFFDFFIFKPGES